jgi:hypothetical protein
VKTPSASKRAAVVGEAGLVKITGPGPLTRLHSEPSEPPAGRPSSLTWPASTSTAVVTGPSRPALTRGGSLPGFATISTSSLAESSPSVAVSRSTYVPGAPNVAVVAALAASPKTTPAGPLTTLQAEVSDEPSGFPSSLTEPTSVVVSPSTRWSSPALTTGGTLAGSKTTVTSSLA